MKIGKFRYHKGAFQKLFEDFYSFGLDNVQVVKRWTKQAEKLKMLKIETNSLDCFKILNTQKT